MLTHLLFLQNTASLSVKAHIVVNDPSTTSAEVCSLDMRDPCGPQQIEHFTMIVWKCSDDLALSIEHTYDLDVEERFGGDQVV